MDIRHYVSGEMKVQDISNFLAECSERFPIEVGSPDLVEWPSKLAANADCFCVFRSDGSLAAALFAYLNDAVMHVGYIPFLCSLPESEKGTAYRLHEAFRKEAGKRGMIRLRLEVVKSNVHAYNFYLRQGYTIAEDRADRNRWLMEVSV